MIFLKKIRVGMFSAYSVKTIFLFPTKKSKDYFLPKSTVINGISGINKKYYAHPRKDDICILD